MQRGYRHAAAASAVRYWPGSSAEISWHIVRRALAGVGGNLQDHLQIRTIFKVRDITTLNSTANTLGGKMRIALEYLFKRSGPMSMAPSQLGAFVKSDKRLKHLICSTMSSPYR